MFIHGFNSQPPEGGWISKAAAWPITGRFNSQPPEGGWVSFPPRSYDLNVFQLTAARRRLDPSPEEYDPVADVSTHSRPKAAGQKYHETDIFHKSFNSQPPEGGWGLLNARRGGRVSFNSQPPEGGWG